MSCPTCDETMQGVGPAGTFWCPRCGTLKVGSGAEAPAAVEAPRLVGRCREFEAETVKDGDGVDNYYVNWHRLGIAEAIHPPGQRFTL